MKPQLIATVLFLSTVLCSSLCAENLIGADGLENWTITGPEVCWSIKDGVITGVNDPDKKGGILWTKPSYGDFTLKGEFKFSGSIDSGIFIRNANEQIQIGISGSLKRDMTGSPYIGSKGSYPVEAEGVAALLKEGDWNSFTLVATGSRYVFHLNGKQVLDYTSDTAIKEGPIGFQVHPNVEMKVEFRNLAIEEEEA